MLISIDMGILLYLRNTADDIHHKICVYKWKFIICVLSCLLGFALGIALFYAFRYGWWYFNRTAFADKIIQAGFDVVIYFAVTSLFAYFGFALCGLTKGTHYIRLAVSCVICFYCGACVVALFTISVMWGILYLLFIALADLAFCAVACFCCICEKAVCRTFRESLCDQTQTAAIIITWTVYKLLAFFVVIKILTCLI